MTEETLFQKALTKSPEERAVFLDAARAGQPQLRTAVESLLAAHEKSANELDQRPVELCRTATLKGLHRVFRSTGERAG